MVFVSLIDIVVILLYVVMMISSLLECCVQEGRSAAVLSARVRMSDVGICDCMTRRRESVTMSKMRGDNGQPCRIPLVAVKQL